MPANDPPEKGCQKKHLHSRANNNMDVKNRNKEMYWVGGRNVVATQSVHSVPTVSHSPTLQDIPEESEECSEDDGGGLAANCFSHSRVYDRKTYRSAPSTHVVFESFAKDTSSTNLSKLQSKADNTEESEKRIELLDKEFTDLLFLQFNILKKTLLETKEQKQDVEDKLDFCRKENESLKEKIINFQNQEDAMIADRRDLSTQLVIVREKLIQSQLQQRSLKENRDLCQQNHKLQDDNATLKKENELMKCKLENCQNTIKKMMGENSSLKKDEKSYKIREEHAEAEISRLAIELAMWKQKAKKAENSSAASSFISDNQIDNSNLLPETKVKGTTSYVEIVSSMRANPSPPTTTTIMYGKSEKNKAITIIKEARNSTDNSKATSQIQLNNGQETLKSSQPSQNINKGIASLLMPEPKESVMRRTDTNKTFSDRLTVVEQKLNPIMDLIENLKKSQDRMGKELDRRLNHNISLITNQICSLRSFFEKAQSRIPATASTSGSSTINKSVSNIGAQKLGNLNKGSTKSKSSIPISITRKSW